ncbi:hypothetical protein E8E12_005602 [Didymella heteroderae]|uniref:Protein kinase domain-containing protein n=1 Tax=Didymella heteroderae TaxID=1769908 RepID=A0A9P4WNH1_9PLEO|nr:hypothetical protein E8E12_005602 [Didymella heteroderae]
MADETPTGGEMDGPTRRSLTRAQIRASLHSNVVRKSDKYPHASQKRSDHYICFEAIKDAWKAPKAVHHVLFPAILSPSLEARIRKELLIYLSILVYIQADDFLNNFKRNFLNREGDLVRSDRHLPLVEDDVPDFNVVDNDVLRFSFFQEQYLFSPVVIKESSRPAEVGHLERLPFESETEETLPGAFGTVTKIFLLEGKDLEGKQVYDFDEEFPVLQNVKFIEGVYTQMAKITEALEWLHKGIKTGGPDEKLVYFAHMDLKPNNILIDDVGDEEPSTVGKWVLTDFGISARKENDEPVSDDFVSIGDVSRRLQSLTINTDPPRGRGSYQPPEVDLWHAGQMDLASVLPDIRISESSSSDDRRSSRQQSQSQSSSGVYTIDSSIRRQGPLVCGTTKEVIDPTIARITDVSPGRIKTMCLSPRGDFAVTIKPEISTAETQHTIEETPYEARILFSANTDISETLIHCAFSDDGHVLYAWSSSNRSDRNKCLRAWSSEQFAGRAPAPAVKKYYIGLKAGDSTASIVPYKGDRNYGFVVKLQGDEFFCSTLAEPMTLCSISSVEVNTDITECMHGADSLLVARYGRTVKGFKVSKCINIYERAIKGDTIHCFEENESRNHIQISTNKDGISAMKEFDLGNGNSIIVLFREDGLLIFAPIGSLRK